jgi:hypothetical protein
MAILSTLLTVTETFVGGVGSVQYLSNRRLTEAAYVSKLRLFSLSTSYPSSFKPRIEERQLLPLPVFGLMKGSNEISVRIKFCRFSTDDLVIHRGEMRKALYTSASLCILLRPVQDLKYGILMSDTSSLSNDNGLSSHLFLR